MEGAIEVIDVVADIVNGETSHTKSFLHLCNGCLHSRVFPDLLSELTLEIFCLPFFLIRAIEIRKVKQVVARVEFVAACILSVYRQCVELRVVEEYKP